MACGFESLQTHQLRNSQHRSVSRLRAENCAMLGISSLSAATRFAGLAAEMRRGMRVRAHPFLSVISSLFGHDSLRWIRGREGDGGMRVRAPFLNDPTHSEQIVVSRSDCIGSFFPYDPYISRAAGFHFQLWGTQILDALTQNIKPDSIPTRQLNGFTLKGLSSAETFLPDAS